MVDVTGKRVEKEREVGGSVKESHLAVGMKSQLTRGEREKSLEHIYQKKQSPVKCIEYHVQLINCGYS